MHILRNDQKINVIIMNTHQHLPFTGICELVVQTDELPENYLPLTMQVAIYLFLLMTCDTGTPMQEISIHCRSLYNSPFVVTLSCVFINHFLSICSMHHMAGSLKLRSNMPVQRLWPFNCSVRIGVRCELH